jgi:diguanylate cyclase (GGDEF)-like protein
LRFDQHQPGYSKKDHNNEIISKQMVVTRVTEHYALFLVNLRLRETLRMEAIRDPLTNLYNRRYMEESLEREIHHAERHKTSIGIIMLDIDHFKSFNDTYGHEAGDIVLRELGVLLRSHTRADDIACRYGGEEFLLIMPEAPLKVVTYRAKELHAKVKDLLRIEYQEQTLTITVSMGVAAFPDHGPGIKDVVNAADTALYQAKAGGRDQVVVASL